MTMSIEYWEELVKVIGKEVGDEIKDKEYEE